MKAPCRAGPRSRSRIEIRIGVPLRTLYKFFKLSAVLLIASLALMASTAQAAPVTGTVRNGTNGKPAAGIDVLLIQLQGEMKPVASTKTDAQGNYTLDNPAAPRDAMPMLI